MFGKIIQLSTEKLPWKAYVTLFDLTCDAELDAHSDWVSVEREFEDVAKEIADKLSGFCFINRGKRTLTFKKPGTLRSGYLSGVLKLYRQAKGKLLDSGQSGWLNHSDAKTALEGLGVAPDYLFYYDGKCHTLSETILDHLNGELPRVLKIGGILDFHY